MKSPITLAMALGAILVGAVLLRVQPAPAQAAPATGLPAVPYGMETTVYTNDGKSVDGALKGINQDWVVLDGRQADLWVPRSTVRMLRVERSR